VSDLRGNTSSLTYNIVRLYKADNVPEFVKYFPEFKKSTEMVATQIKRVVNQLFSMYIDCFIHKTKKLQEYPADRKPHLWALHKIYMAQRPLPIHKQLVSDYVKKLNQCKLFWLISA
jgi:hypothetical protein